MAFVWTIFYGVLTFGAVGLSLRKDGPIAVMGIIILTFWCWQTVLYFFFPPAVTNIIGLMFDATLLLLLFVIWMRIREAWPVLIGGAIIGQILWHVAFRQGMVSAILFRPILNALYVAQLAVLAWPERVKP